MIKSYLINNVKNEYIPDNALFNEWLSSIEHSEDAEITIKIVTPNEMKNLNILYRDKDKISDTLAFPFDNLFVGKKIILGEGERKSGGNKRDSIIADALEALIAVVYLVDGLEEARLFIKKIFDIFIKTLPSNDDLKDSKTKLQEILQSHNCDLPNYDTKEINKKNKISFVTLCKIIEHNICEDGSGSNKRKSQQVAAAKALNKILEIYKK